MRRLIYIPIIHTDPDLGKVAEPLADQAEEMVGIDNWQKHKKVVCHYWQEIKSFWENKKVFGTKVFQDGLPADGEVGRKIVKELASKGSINYQIIEQLVKKGAQLVKTEDPELLKQEYFLTRELIKGRSFLGGLFTYPYFVWRKKRILTKRDSYIIERINKSLREGQTGICFLGAYHQVLPNLPADIKVVTLKDPKKVREYYQKFLTHKREGEVNSLSHYLTKPINIKLGKNHD